jgi:hypothetical protein
VIYYIFTSSAASFHFAGLNLHLHVQLYPRMLDTLRLAGLDALTFAIGPLTELNVQLYFGRDM